MQITDLKCAILGGSPVVRITTDAGIEGYGQAEHFKAYLKPHVLFYRDYILGQDPTDVERVMLRIRRLGSFKPWGSAVSAIEMALWDIAGQAANVPVYKLLGGKVRDKVLVYNGALRFPMAGQEPEHYAENMARMAEAREGFTIIKQGIGYHSRMPDELDDFSYGERLGVDHQTERGLLTERGFNHVVACVEAMKEVTGDRIGLALDCGPGWTVPDAIRLAKAVEGMHIMWLEDTITGDYTPYVLAELYRELTRSTSTPIHTGEQIYLRQNFQRSVRKAGGQHRRTGPGRYWRHRRTEVGGGIRGPSRHSDGPARDRGRTDRLGCAGAGGRGAAPQLHRLRVPCRPAGMVV